LAEEDLGMELWHKSNAGFVAGNWQSDVSFMLSALGDDASVPGGSGQRGEQLGLDYCMPVSALWVRQGAPCVM